MSTRVSEDGGLGRELRYSLLYRVRDGRWSVYVCELERTACRRVQQCTDHRGTYRELYLYTAEAANHYTRSGHCPSALHVSPLHVALFLCFYRTHRSDGLGDCTVIDWLKYLIPVSPDTCLSAPPFARLVCQGDEDSHRRGTGPLRRGYSRLRRSLREWGQRRSGYRGCSRHYPVSTPPHAPRVLDIASPLPFDPDGALWKRLGRGRGERTRGCCTTTRHRYIPDKCSGSPLSAPTRPVRQSTSPTYGAQGVHSEYQEARTHPKVVPVLDVRLYLQSRGEVLARVYCGRREHAVYAGEDGRCARQGGEDEGGESVHGVVSVAR